MEKRHLISAVFLILSVVAGVGLSTLPRDEKIATSTQAQSKSISYTTEAKPLVALDAQSSCLPQKTLGVKQSRIKSDTVKAQTFTADADELLRGVEIAGINHNNATTLAVWEARVGSTGKLELTTQLSSIAIFCGTYFEFIQPIQLKQNQLYALVLSGTKHGYYAWNYQQTGGSVCKGSSYTSTDAGQTWGGNDVEDFNFELYVEDTSDDRAETSSTRFGVPPKKPAKAKRTYQPHVSSCKRTISQTGVRNIPTMVILVPDESGQKPTKNIFSLTEQVMSVIEEASVFQGYKKPDNPQYLDYSLYQNTLFKLDKKPTKQSNGWYDLKEIFDSLNICNLVQQNEVAEVWLWEAGKGGWDEYDLNGPEYRRNGNDYQWNANMPNCGKHLATMIFNYNASQANALHSFTHRIEGQLGSYFRCLFDNNKCIEMERSTATSFNRRPSQINNFISGCGTVHHPANVIKRPEDTDDAGLQHNRDYMYNSMEKVLSYCEDWSGDPTKSKPKEVNCETWGTCNSDYPDNQESTGYYVWWMQNMPGYNNNLKDASGKAMPNWLAYLYGYPLPDSSSSPAGKSCSIKFSGLLYECKDQSCKESLPLRVDLPAHQNSAWALKDSIIATNGATFTYNSEKDNTTASYQRSQAARTRANSLRVASCWQTEGAPGLVAVREQVRKAQTFRAAKGILKSIILSGGVSGTGTATLTLKEEQDLSRTDQVANLAQVSITGGSTFDFPSDIILDPQKTYVMILSFTGDGQFDWYYSSEGKCTSYGTSLSYDAAKNVWIRDAVSFQYIIGEDVEQLHGINKYERRYDGCRSDLAVGVNSTPQQQRGQIFTADKTSMLNEIVLWGKNEGGTTKLELQTVDGQSPSGKQIASTSIDTGNTFDFRSANVILEEGKRYALLVSHEGEGVFRWQYQEHPCTGSFSHDLNYNQNKGMWNIGSVGFYFTVYGQNSGALDGGYVVGRDIYSQLMYDENKYSIVSTSLDKCAWNGQSPKPQYVSGTNYCHNDPKPQDSAIEGLVVQCNMEYQSTWKVLRKSGVATSTVPIPQKNEDIDRERESQLQADFNGDGVVNTLDLSMLLGLYGEEDISAEYDLVGNGRIDALDITKFIEVWRDRYN